MKNPNEVILKIRSLLEKAKKPVLFYDTDADGGTSYLQLKNKFPNLIGFPISKARDLQREVWDRVSFNPDLVLFFDTPLVEEFMFDFYKDINIVWVDHHPHNDKSLVSKYDILHFNPLDFNPKDSRSACYWAYKIADLEENLAYACIGTVTDFYVLDVLNELFEKDKKNFDLIFNLSESKREELFDFVLKNSYDDNLSYEKRIDWVQFLIFETPLKKLRLLFDFVYKLDYDDTLKAIRLIKNCSLKELLESIDIGKGFLFEELNEFISTLDKLVKDAIEKYGDDEFIELRHTEKWSFNRHLADELLYKCKNAKVIVSSFDKYKSPVIAYSFRGKKGFIVNDIIEQSVEGLEGKGGGHPFGGGAAVVKKDVKDFEDSYRKLINERLKELA